MKAKSLLIAALAISSFAACSKSATEPENSGDGVNASYLNVQIAYTDAAATKAVGDATNPFYYGTADEQAVVSANFFFYYSDGSYCTQVARTIYKESAETAGQGNKNVEWVGKGVVLLANIATKPAYMAVVLNADDELVNNLSGKTAVQAKDVLTSKIATLSGSTWTNFVMSSSSYVNGNATGYYLNTLQDSDFKSTEAEALATSAPVEVYVERLAAKIELKLAGTSTANQYEIGTYTVDGTNKKLYAKIDSWGLNATTKNTYNYKVIDPAWTLSFNGASWSDPTNFRTYWGKSSNYGTTTYYPDSYANSTNSRNYEGSTATVLDYVSYNDLAVAVGSAAYCRENTNNPASFTGADAPVNYNTTFTSVLLKATLVDDAGAAVDAINYDGQLYTVAGYKARILARYKALDADKYIPWKSTGASSYEQIAVADLKDPADLHDGYTGLELKDGTYYQKDGSSYVELTAAEATKVLNYGDKASTETGYDNTKGLYYKNGQMYYTIPVEHLNNGVKYNNIAGTACTEGDYGVVRNHYYSVTVNSVKNLGSAVYDPDEKIFPNDNTYKRYFLAAKVNILSWKLVNQTVDL